MRGVLFVVLAWVAMGTWPVPVSGTSHAQDPLAQCMTSALERLDPTDARAVGKANVGFLTEEESRSESVKLARDGCVGVLAVGRERVRDLDLWLHTAGGIELARDVEIAPYGYVRYCGSAGLRLRATVHMYKGRGEYRMVTIRNAPPLLPDLGRTVGRCFAAGTGVRRPIADVGPEPPGPSVADAAAQVERDMQQLGYRRARDAQTGELEQRGIAHHAMRLQGRRCYAVSVVGGPDVQDLDMLIRASDARLVARDVTRSRNGLAKFCVEDDADYVTEIRMYEGAGAWRLDLYRLEEPAASARPAGLEGRARVMWAEAHARMRARGMEARAVAWGLVQPERGLSMPVELEAGSCYAFAGVPGEGLRGGDLDLLLVDDAGALMAWDLGMAQDPLMFHCAQSTGVYRVRGRALRARGRYLLVMGRGEEGGDGERGGEGGGS